MAVENPQVRLRKFEGPLDLLFHLIEKNDIDIYDIPIAEVTDQYMEYLDKMNSLDMEVASEFLLMAATLVHIKSRMLLPDRNVSETDAEADPREELVVKLLDILRQGREKASKKAEETIREVRKAVKIGFDTVE